MHRSVLTILYGKHILSSVSGYKVEWEVKMSGRKRFTVTTAIFVMAVTVTLSFGCEPPASQTDAGLEQELRSISQTNSELANTLEAVSQTNSELANSLEAVSQTNSDLVSTLELNTQTNSELVNSLEVVAQTNSDLLEEVRVANQLNSELAQDVQSMSRASEGLAEAIQTSSDLVSTVEEVTQTNSELLEEVRATNQLNSELATDVQSMSRANHGLAEAVWTLDDTLAAQSAVAAPTPTPPSVGRRDICYRALAVQKTLLDKFGGPDLCAAISVGELYRLEELSIDDGRDLRREDFADMLNLRFLRLSFVGDNLPADVFSELTGLKSLDLRVNDLSALPPGGFVGVNGLESLEVSVRLGGGDVHSAGLFEGLSGLQSLELVIYPEPSDDKSVVVLLPDDLFSGAPNLQNLEVYVDGSYGACVDLSPGTFNGLAGLETLHVTGAYIGEVPHGVFEDQVALNELELSYPCPDDEGRQDEYEVYVVNYEVAFRLGDSCGPYCVIAGVVDEKQ